MNIFEKQKEEKNKKIETLEEMKVAIEELKSLEKKLQETSMNLNRKYILLSEQFEKIDISKIGSTILSNDFRIKDQISNLEKSVIIFKNETLEIADNNITRYSKQILILVYIPCILFLIVLGTIVFSYFTNVRYIKNQAEELVKQNDLLKNRINSVYWIIAEDNKYWYDQENKKLFINDNEWFKKKLKTPSKKKK